MEDERLTKINQEKQNAINNSNNVYNGLLQDNQNLFNQQNNYATEYEKIQNESLDKQLAFNEQKINQQKEIARQNMEAEQKRAKNDYTAFNNPYGYQAESFASNGLLNSGVSETAKLGGFNTYQNRLASANKVMQDAFVQYDNDINEARLNNDVQKAQNALAKLEIQMNASKDFYSNKSTLTQNQLSYNQGIDDNYNNRYQIMYENIQNEKAQAEAQRQWEAEMAERQRQYNESMAYQKEQDKIAQQQWEKEYQLSKQVNNYKYGGSSSSGGAVLTGGDSLVIDGKQGNQTSYTAKDLNLPYTSGNEPIYEAGGSYYVVLNGEPINVTNEYNALKNKGTGFLSKITGTLRNAVNSAKNSKNNSGNSYMEQKIKEITEQNRSKIGYTR